jgi:hypothetical protein
MKIFLMNYDDVVPFFPQFHCPLHLSAVTRIGPTGIAVSANHEVVNPFRDTIDRCATPVCNRHGKILP